MAYDIRPVIAHDSEIQKTSELLRNVFKKQHFTPGFLKWQYFDNPAGQAIGYNAWTETEEIAAHYVTQAVLYNWNGRIVKGLLSLNTVTHPMHQGKGLFLELAEKTYGAAASSGFEFVIGIANQNSTHGFVNKLGFYLVGRLDAKLGLGNIQYFNKPIYDFERCWDKASLEWRLSNPQFQYEIKRENILATTGKLGIKAMIGKFSSEILSGLPSSDLGTDFLKLWIGTDPNINWKGSFYFSIPEKLKPAPLNLIFKDLSGKGRNIDLSKVRFQAMDFDAY
jgi:hypothetical protein